ncbi:hypothetical protein [Nostoc sp. MS1]|uniref:hypothetical protein n=1 Tax=Nostoc sp. MS1 TaxID=2764711 RepID=UPI001CC512C1|nr:hypothetical protein [Nostoc sp. MS1]BCL34583.1 hypothetical protein NSMS1_10300 [Nostoc sp. MS1]
MKTNETPLPEILWSNTHSSIVSRQQYRQDKLELPDYMTYKYIQKIANSSIKTHRMESYVTTALCSLGLTASVIPNVADGYTNDKEADILISTAGSMLALEVKTAKYRGAILGEPIDDTIAGANGFDSLPRWLWVDSVKAWRAKERTHRQREQQLIGCVVLAPIGNWSDEHETVYGAIYLPANLRQHWNIDEAYNPYKRTRYNAFQCPRRYMRTIADLVAEVNEYAA